MSQKLPDEHGARISCSDIVLLITQASIINRASGLPYPLWAPHIHVSWRSLRRLSSRAR